MDNNKTINQLIPIAVIAITVSGFLVDRVLFSIGVLFAAMLCIHFKFWKISFVKNNAIIYSILAIIGIYIASDLMYSNFEIISGRSWMKFLLLLFPIFIWSWNPDKKAISTVNKILLIAGLVISFYSLKEYFLHYSSINLQYERAKVMPVLAFGDHIRISWFIAITCILAFYEQIKEVKGKKYIFIVYIIFQIIFLHLLGAKTGLLTLYTIGLVLGIGYIIKKRKLLLLVPLLLTLMLGPLVAYKTLPSFQKRVQFIIYDYNHYSNGNYRGGLSDAIRFYSIKGGLDLFKEQPLTGYGFINSKDRMAQWYSSKYPVIEPSSYTLPSNQLLIFGIGFGLLGALVFVFHIISPLLYKSIRTDIIFMSFYISTTISFVYETHLETQMGIFVYGFFLAWLIQISRDRIVENHNSNP